MHRAFCAHALAGKDNDDDFDPSASSSAFFDSDSKSWLEIGGRTTETKNENDIVADAATKYVIQPVDNTQWDDRRDTYSNLMEKCFGEALG